MYCIYKTTTPKQQPQQQTYTIYQRFMIWKLGLFAFSIEWIVLQSMIFTKVYVFIQNVPYTHASNVFLFQ